MRGDLSRTSAADACRELAREAATGLLTIDGPDGPGTVSLISGRIVAASSPTPRARLGDRLVGASYLDERDLDDALRLQRSGEGHARLGVLLVERGLVSRDAVRLFIQEQMLDALFDILRWRFGAYEFIHGEATEVLEIPLSIAVDEILVEVARRQQEWEQLSQVIPDLESVPSFRDGASSASAALEPDEFAVLASVDGERSVRALASDLGYGEFEAARIIYGLCLLGIVEVRLPEDEVGAAFDDAFSGHDGGGRSDDQPVEDGDEVVAAGVDETADDEVVVEAELDVDFSALIAEFTGARPPADGATAEDPEREGPEPFEARIDDDRHDDTHHGDAEPVGTEVTDGAGTADAADWPGSAAWPDEPPVEPQPADDDVDEAAGAGGEDDDTGPIPIPPEFSRDLPDPEPAAMSVADDDRSEVAHDWTPLAADPIAPPDPIHTDAAHPEPDEPSDVPDALPPPTDDEADALDDGASRPDDGAAVADAVAASGDATGDATEDEASATGSGGGDVSEFLRELSRLALDPEDAAKQRPRPSRVSPAADDDSSPPPKREEDKPKKRGLFGWGG